MNEETSSSRLIEVVEGTCSDCGEGATVIKVGYYFGHRSACRKCVKHPIMATEILLRKNPADGLIVEIMEAFRSFQAGGSPRLELPGPGEGMLDAKVIDSGTCTRCGSTEGKMIQVSGNKTVPPSFCSCFPCGGVLVDTLRTSTQMILDSLTGNPHLPRFKIEAQEQIAWIEQLVRSGGKGN